MSVCRNFTTLLTKRTSILSKCALIAGTLAIKSNLCRHRSFFNWSFSSTPKKQTFDPIGLKARRQKISKSDKLYGWQILMIRIFLEKSFSERTFLKGATEGVILVSRLIAQGLFEDLHGLVHSKVLNDLESCCAKLNAEEQRRIELIALIDFFGVLRSIESIQFYEVKDGKRKLLPFFADKLKALINLKKGTDDARLLVQVNVGLVLASREIIDISIKYSFTEAITQILNGQCVYCYYSFCKEYPKKEEEDWTINFIKHYPIYIRK